MNFSNIKKAYYYLKRNGIPQTLGAALERISSPYYKDYSYRPPGEDALEKQRQKKWEKTPVFSILVPAYETGEKYMRRLTASLMEQTYPFWQLVVADAGSGSSVRKVCKACQDERICYVKLEENRGISENTNRALEYATGDYIGLLDHDDFLAPDALYEMALAIERAAADKKEYAFLYSDEDKCDEGGSTFYDPHFKTDFNLDLLLSNNYICHFLVMSAPLMKRLGLRPGFDGAQDYDLVLRAVADIWDKTPAVEEQIYHVPRILYHWRCHNNSTAANPGSKSYAYKAGRRALQDFCDNRGWKTRVKELPHLGFYKVIYENGIFSQRDDIAALGGKEIKRGRITGSVFDCQGRALYQGLPAFYSGYLHRACLTQNVAQLDIEKWQLNPKILKKYETFLKATASDTCIPKAEKRKILCDFLRREGYRLYWDPDWRL